MNRRGFLQALGLMAVAVVAAPVISAIPKPEPERVWFQPIGYPLKHTDLDFTGYVNDGINRDHDIRYYINTYTDHDGRYFIKKNEDHDCRYPYNLATA